MAKAYANGQLISGSTNYASSVRYIDENNNETTVQQGIDKINNTIKNFQANIAYPTEEIPVGTWIDGKIVYRKIFLITAISVPNSGGVDVKNDAFKIMDSVLNVSAFRRNMSSYKNMGGNALALHDSGSNIIQLYHPSGMSSISILLIDYTKV